MTSEQYRGGGLVLEKGTHDPILGTPQDFLAPEFMDLSMYLRCIENQGHEPWCAAYAGCCVGQAVAWKQTNVPRDFDEEALYLNSKSRDGLPPDTPGTTERAMLEAALDMGVLPAGTTWCAVPSYNAMRFALHKYGWVVGGFKLHENWQPNHMLPGGIIQNSPRLEYMGAHEVVIVGYTSTGDVVITNSWGQRWGSNGYGTMSGWSFQQDWLGGRAIVIPDNNRETSG